MKSKKFFLLFIVSMFLISVLSACSSSTKTSNDAVLGKLDPNKPTKITFYSYSLTYPTMKPGMEHLIKEFNDTVGKEKGVIVEGVPDPTTQQFKADIAAGKQVDVIQHPFSTLDASKETLGFKAYEDVIPKQELDQHLKGISPNALSLGKIDGKTYGLAFTFSTPIVFINGKLFEEAGLDPNNPPKTWDEVKEDSLKIKKATGKDGFGLPPDNGWVTEGLIYSNGGEVLSKDRKKAEFASKQSVEAIEKWKDIYKNGASAVGSDKEVAQQFMAGNLGMYVSSTSYYSGITKAAQAGGWKVYGAALPQFGDKPSVPVNSGSALAIRPDTPEKTAAVWEFIKFATGNEGYKIITSEIGYLPLRTGLADDPKYLKDFVDQNPLYKINLKQLSQIHPVTIWPGEYATECYTIFTDAIVKSVSTDADVKTTLTDAQNQMNNIIK
jgi:multiple sugar transport system substrate-binding protein